MSHPELSLPPTSVRDQFLDLAALICRQEFPTIATKDNGLTYQWEPVDQAAFTEPLELKDISWTSHPQWNNNFKIVEAKFALLGDNDMTMEVSRRFRDGDKFDESLNDDPLADLVLGIFKSSYLSHQHQACLQAPVLANVKPDENPEESYKYTDRRRIVL